MMNTKARRKSKAAADLSERDLAMIQAALKDVSGGSEYMAMKIVDRAIRELDNLEDLVKRYKSGNPKKEGNHGTL